MVLIATGIVRIFAGIIEHPFVENWNGIGIIVGVSAIMAAIIIITFIDKWDEKKKNKN